MKPKHRRTKLGILSLWTSLTIAPLLRAAPGEVDTLFAPALVGNDRVVTVAVQSDGKILMGGGFTSVGGEVRRGIARLNPDGSLDLSFSPDVRNLGFVSSIVIASDGKLLIGGAFSQINGTRRDGIARLNADGTLDATFDPGTGVFNEIGYQVFAVMIQPDGKGLIGGDFIAYNGVSRGAIARVNPGGSLDTTFNPGTGFSGGDLTAVYAIAAQLDGKLIVGGDFTSYNGAARNRIVRVHSNGGLDTSFNPSLGGASPYVSSVIALSDGKALIGGQFTSVGGVTRNGIARLNASGSLDTGFNPGTGVSGGTFWTGVTAIAVQADGKAIIGGAFASYNGVSRNGIARLKTDGSLDASFNPGAGVLGPNFVGGVSAIALQSDGNAVLGGEFTSVNGIARSRVARIHANYLPSRLEITLVDGLPSLHLTGEVGQQYVLEYTSDLAGGASWTTLPAFTLANNPQTITDETATNAEQRYYRARLLSP